MLGNCLQNCRGTVFKSVGELSPKALSGNCLIGELTLVPIKTTCHHLSLDISCHQIVRPKSCHTSILFVFLLFWGTLLLYFKNCQIAKYIVKFISSILACFTNPRLVFAYVIRQADSLGLSRKPDIPWSQLLRCSHIKWKCLNKRLK